MLCFSRLTSVGVVSQQSPNISFFTTVCCWDVSATTQGAGCALMGRHSRFEGIVRGMSAVRTALLFLFLCLCLCTFSVCLFSPFSALILVSLDRIVLLAPSVHGGPITHCDEGLPWLPRLCS